MVEAKPVGYYILLVGGALLALGIWVNGAATGRVVGSFLGQVSQFGSAIAPDRVEGNEFDRTQNLSEGPAETTIVVEPSNQGIPEPGETDGECNSEGRAVHLGCYSLDRNGEMRFDPPPTTTVPLDPTGGDERAAGP